MVRGKTEFTSSEYEKLIELVEELQRVDPSKQKGIRKKLRALGLYWSEVGSGKVYTRENVEELFKTGSLKIAGENGNTPATAVVEDNRLHTKNSTKASRVFISYKRKNKDLVFPIKEKIERALGESCWIDLDGIESSAQFVKVIIKAIDRCEVFLFMHSSLHANISDIEKDWTIRELQYAEEENKRIVFINLDRSKLGKWFKFMFGQKQQIDALDPEAIERLISDLKTWLDIPVIYERSTMSFSENKKLLGEQKNILSIENHLGWRLSEPFYYISYSSKDQEIAFELKRMLESRNINVWITPDSIPQGTDYALAVPLALNCCDNFILILTENSARSTWVLRELDMAISHPEKKINVILYNFTIDEIHDDPQLMFYLNKIQIKYQFYNNLFNPLPSVCDNLDRFISE